jgi:hypothetical protein
MMGAMHRMPQFRPLLIAAAVVWVATVVMAHATQTGEWLLTIGQTALLFAVTGLLAWAGAETDNMIDEMLGRGGSQGGSRRAWPIRLPAQKTARGRGPRR